ncbi:hypothetical protein QFC21_006139 [Naganishia friedmannii]|uniref:Uncharacterized protein n=1 Tax=Naganishia friedmannii TaxID=89922 RepID=A0ACC2V4J8_9TREE|nr:hypothetical protein QFC21_006139 [Naganishia friedmannii]
MLRSQDRQAAYEKACQEKSNLIRKTEHENMKHGRRRNRDLQAFRAALTTLQSLVDDLDFLKSSYHHEVMEGEDELWNGVLDKIAFVARAKMDVHDKVSSKSNDPSLEPLLHPIMNTVEDGAPFGDGTILNALAPLSLMSTPKSPQPALSRTPSRTPRRLQTPPSREIGGLPDSQSSPLGVPTQFDGLSQDKKGQNGTANTDRPDSAKDRRSFFGRLFKPSTDNLRTPGVGSSGPATSLTRHGRHHSQQSIASTAETYTEDSEVDDATDSRRRERNERVLMGRSVPSAKRGDAVKPGEKKLMPRVHVHAPIPNPRRTTSSPSVGGRQGRDQRELSVIEDDEAEDSRDSAVEGVAMLEGGAENGRIDDMEQGEIAETGSESLISDTSAMVIDASPTSAPASLGSRGVRDEKEGTGSPSNRIPEITSQSSATDFDQSSAKEQRLTDDPERDHGDQDQEMPSAPPSPSLEHELETIRDNSRRKASA